MLLSPRSRRVLCALICTVPLGTCLGALAAAQTHVPAKPAVPAPLDSVPPNVNFDIVSFKRCPADKFGTTKVDMPMAADYLAYHCESLSRIIYFAYNGAVKVHKLDGPYPKWVDKDRYEFVVKIAPEDIPAWQKLNLNARRLLIRKVLADSVKLKIRVDNSPKSIYALIATSKVNLRPFKTGDQTKLPDGQLQSGRASDYMGTVAYFQAFTMADFTEVLTIHLDRVTADQTNLTGSYIFSMPWVPGDGLDPSVRVNGDDGPSTQDGLAELGLRLVTTKAPVERLVIDHIEMPPEN